MRKEDILKSCSWVLAGVVVVLALLVWAGERLGGKALTAYDIFPLLGLVAFSLMWTHYVLGSLRRKLGVSGAANKQYFKASSLVVLICLLLHPGLLIFQLNRDGFGLPPQSYMEVYAEPIMRGAIMLGTIALLIFLAFEFHRKFRKKSWWKYVNRAQVMAMFLIFYHGLTLGRELTVGWYKVTWWLYGVGLVAALLCNYWYDKRVAREV